MRNISGEKVGSTDRRTFVKGVSGMGSVAISSLFSLQNESVLVSPEACYDFEGSGSQVEDNCNSHTGELVRAERVSGPSGKAVRFNAHDNSYARLGSSDTLDPRDGSYSISFWFQVGSVTPNPDTRGTNDKLVSKRGDDNERFTVGIRGTEQSRGQILFSISDHPGLDADKVRSSESYLDNFWHHVVAVRDTAEGEIRLYVDGVEVDSGEDTQGDINPTGPLFLGGQPLYPNPRYTTGKMDDVRVYENAVGSAQVALLYLEGQANHTA